MEDLVRGCLAAATTKLVTGWDGSAAAFGRTGKILGLFHRAFLAEKSPTAGSSSDSQRLSSLFCSQDGRRRSLCRSRPRQGRNLLSHRGVSDCRSPKIAARPPRQTQGFVVKRRVRWSPRPYVGDSPPLR